MLFGRRKPGFAQEVDVADPEQAIKTIQAQEMAAKKKPKAAEFDIDAACEAAKRAEESDRSIEWAQGQLRATKWEHAPENGEAASRQAQDCCTAASAAAAANAADGAQAQASPEPVQAAQAAAEAGKPELFSYLAAQPETQGDEFADIPTVEKPPQPELTPAQQLAGYIRSRSAAAQLTSYELLKTEVENADELIAQMLADPQCKDIVSRDGKKGRYFYSDKNMSTNYSMIAALLEDGDECAIVGEMVRFNARTYPSATPLRYFARSPYSWPKEKILSVWGKMKTMPEYSDIEELVNNEDTHFLFSTKYLSRRYAQAISDVDLYCD